MANTPLELYDSAYRLHYHEKKIPEAIKIYEGIIRDFPESNECGYAVIQLQKIKANNITSALKKSSNGVYPLLVISFLSSVIALLVSLFGIVFLVYQLRIEHHRLTLTAAALSKMSSGKDESALKIIDDLKKLSPRDVLPLELTSDIDRKHELRGTMAISPPPAGVADTVPRNRDFGDASVTEQGGAVSVDREPRPSERAKAAGSSSKRRSGKKNKSLFIVDPDSLSFF